MTCEDLLEWAESQLGDFNSYDDINQFEEDLTSSPNKASNVDARTSNAISKLQDWFNNNLDVDGYDSNEVKGNILSNKVDKTETLPELDEIDTGILSGGIKTGVDKKIEDKRAELGEEELQVIKDQIAGAKSRADIDITIGPIQREYGKERADEIRELIAEKADEFQTIEDEFKESIESQIDEASTTFALDSIERMAGDAPTTRLEQDLLRQIESKRGQLE